MDPSPDLALDQRTVDIENLRLYTRWIRDILDPQVAREGPDILHPDDVLTLDEFLRGLLNLSSIGVEDLRLSRIHLAILTISTQATRWPWKLIDRCDAIRSIWTARFGPLRHLKLPLYEPGGRLHGLCTHDSVNPEDLIVTWLKNAGSSLSSLASHRPGCLGFTPGEWVTMNFGTYSLACLCQTDTNNSWWLSALFAHRAGIIDTCYGKGGIIADAHSVYAIVMAGNDEICSPDPTTFRYRAGSRDPGRYRLTAGTPASRKPIRVLRSHSLRSWWTPKAGLRYDGLHIVTGWSITKDDKTDEIDYCITFKRLASEISMEHVLCRPWTDELEDYAEYKRLQYSSPRSSESGALPGLLTFIANQAAEKDTPEV